MRIGCSRDAVYAEWFRSFTKAKSKLFACGSRQREHMDFGEKFATTISGSCVRLLASIKCELLYLEGYSFTAATACNCPLITPGIFSKPATRHISWCTNPKDLEPYALDLTTGSKVAVSKGMTLSNESKRFQRARHRKGARGATIANARKVTMHARTEP